MATVGEIFGVIKLKGGQQFAREFRSMSERVRNEVGNVRTAIQAAFSGLVIKELNDAANELEKSNRKLAATSKLTGADLGTLQQVAGKTKDDFKLNASQANEFTIALTKLGQKAGDTNRTADAIGRLLDLASAQGLNAEEALMAINQAILGIDEGTDKLFQKNPSAIYAEYAKQIGTTAGKLDDQQKAQALLNAVMESGEKVQGEYENFLKSSAGRQQVFTTRLNEAKAAFGKLIQSFSPVMELATEFLQWLNNSSASTRNFVGAIGLAIVELKLLNIAVVALYPAMGPLGWLAAGVLAIGSAFVFLEKNVSSAAEGLDKVEKIVSGFDISDSEIKKRQQKIKDSFSIDFIKNQLPVVEKDLKNVREQLRQALLKEQEGKGLRKYDPFFEPIDPIAVERIKGELRDLTLEYKAYQSVLDELQKKATERTALSEADRKAAAARELDQARLHGKMLLEQEKWLADQRTQLAKDYYSKTMEAASEASRKIQEELTQINEEIAEQLEQQRQRVERIAAALTITIENALNTFGDKMALVFDKQKTKFKDIWKGILLDLLNFVEQELVIAKIHALIQGVFSQGVSLLKDLPALLSIGVGIEAAKGYVRAMATGGVVTQPTLALIGEAGPEVVAPYDQFQDFANRIIDKVQGGNNFRGGDINLNFSGPLHDRRVVTKLSREVLRPAIERDLKKARRVVNEDVLRKG